MQDIPRDDFSMLNGGDAGTHSTDKDMYPTLIYKIQNTSPLNSAAINLPQQTTNENNEATSIVPVKLEDINTIELFPSNSSSWQNYQIHDISEHRSFLETPNTFDRNCTQLLLQGSDDPLISHGANSVLSNDDEHPAEFARSLITPASKHFQNAASKQENHRELRNVSTQQSENTQKPLVRSGCSNLTRQQLKVKANLMSAQNRQQQNNQNITTPLNTPAIDTNSNQKSQRTQKNKNKKASPVKLRFHHQALPPEYLSHYEATQGQQQISKNQTNLKACNQRSTSKTTNNFQRQSQPRNSHENVRSWLQKIAEIQRTANASKESATSQTQKPIEKERFKASTSKTCESQDAVNRVSTDVNNNQKTPKRLESLNKSSSAHFTEHNDTFLVGGNNFTHSKRSHYSDLPFMGEITLDNCKPRRGRKPKKADICHLIYKNYGTILPKKTKPENCRSNTVATLNHQNQSFKKDTHEQPLNLCLRDQLNDAYSISSGDELSETNSSCPTPIGHAFDYLRDSMLASKLKKSLKNISEPNDTQMTHQSSSVNEENAPQPINICYKKLLESGALLNNANGHYKTITKDNQLALKIPIPSDFFLTQKLDKSSPSRPIVVNVDNTEEVLPTSSANQLENSLSNGVSMNSNQLLIAPQKRKRSAIFIPPMNIENTNNPATEVSICKFKFTGGSKPTLQEKKMVSVDAGGNYRYFSGTGDKASRGYEYFPRESLQHTAGLLPGVNCTGQKFCVDIPPSLSSLSHDLLYIPESSTSSALLSGRTFNVNTDALSANSTATHSEVSRNEACSLPIRENSSFSSSSPTISATTNQCTVQLKKNSNPNQVKKLSRKEKLQKTFKEQGFLIQTQQLESAEGATYCKFRQLKKFTRYLFRNWKDYLPNHNFSDIPEFSSSTDTVKLPSSNC